ncbi:MAG: hypothetical protein HY060_10915 [Proteobacteria bacterium]|nr:hypothetical protein [Pseudomonadota bacterium]
MRFAIPIRARSLLPSMAVYAACLPFEAFCVDGRCADQPGWLVLLLGFFSVGETRANMTWLANPILFSAWVMIGFGEKAIAIVLSLVALVAAAAFLFMNTVITDASGTLLPITGVTVGYWLWLASMATACLGAIFLRRPDAARKTSA